MPKITYIASDGNETIVDAKEGMSVMQSAVNNGVDGIVAECGGACSCATCHVYVDEAWFDKLPEAQAMEKGNAGLCHESATDQPAELPDQGDRRTGRPGCKYPGIAVLMQTRSCFSGNLA